MNELPWLIHLSLLTWILHYFPISFPCLGPASPQYSPLTNARCPSFIFEFTSSSGPERPLRPWDPSGPDVCCTCSLYPAASILVHMSPLITWSFPIFQDSASLSLPSNTLRWQQYPFQEILQIPLCHIGGLDPWQVWYTCVRKNSGIRRVSNNLMCQPMITETLWHKSRRCLSAYLRLFLVFTLKTVMQ